MKKNWLSQPSSVPKRKKKQTPNKQDSPIIMQEKLWTPPIDPFFQLLYARTWKRTKNQLWIKNFTTRQFLNKTFRPAYFWNKNCTKCHILNSKKKVSAFELKFEQGVRFWTKSFSTNRIFKKITFEKSRFGSFWSVKIIFFSSFSKGIILS